MNRQQRRNAQRNQPAYKRMGHDQLMSALAKNGITPNDLQTAKQDGYKLGVESTMYTCYAAFCLVLDEEFSTDRETMIRVLQNVDDKVTFTLDSKEIIDEVLEKYGLKIEFRDSFDRIQEA